MWVTSTLLLFASADLVEDGITDTEDVHDDGVFQQGKEVVGHSLPEMQQEVLDLEQQQFDKPSKSGASRNVCRSRGRHLLEVHVDGVVQDALAVSFIHHDQSFHLKTKAMQTEKQITHQGDVAEEDGPCLWRYFPAGEDAEHWGSLGAAFRFWSSRSIFW